MDWSKIGGRLYGLSSPKNQNVASSSSHRTTETPRVEFDVAGNLRLTFNNEQSQFCPMNHVIELQNILQGQEKQLQELHNDHHKLLEHHVGLMESFNHQQVETDQLMKRRVETERDLHTAHVKIETLRQELSSCKDDLFRLQPKVPTPDNVILKDFETLSEQIVCWVDDELVKYERLHPMTGSKDFFSPGGNRDAASFLKKFPDAGEYLVRFHIHRFLHNVIFGKKVYLFGLSEEQTKTIQDAEEGMANLRPPRDSATISTWRSEALSAIAGSRSFLNGRDQYIDHKVLPDLFHYVMKFLPILDAKNRSNVRLREQVLLPAVEFATKIQLSTSTYVFTQKPSGNPFEGYQEDFAVSATHRHRHKFLDVHSRKTLKPDSTVIEDKEGHFGDVLMQVEPGLSRENKGKESTPLRQAVFLVSLYHPLGKRK